MASLLSRAAAGQRHALWSLYDRSKKTTYGMALLLLQDKEAAHRTVSTVFHTLWSNLINKTVTVENEAAWDTLALTETIAACKRELARHDSKAFRIPQDRRFRLLAPQVAKDDVLQAVLKQFSVFQRAIFVLHTVTALSEDELTAIVKLDRRTWQTALDDERENVEAIGGEGSYDAVCKQMTEAISAVKIPAELDDAVAASITTLSASYAKTHRRKMLTVVGCVLACCVVLCALSGALIWQMSSEGASTTSGDGSTTTTTTAANAEQISEALSTVGTVTTVENPTHYASIDIQDYGTIKVALDANTAPKTVANFVSLAESGFYDGLTFHRIIENFMMQGGDPNADNTGGSGENVVGEFAQNGIKNPLSHVRGAISMARGTDNDSGSSQFFIVHQDSTYLDGEYAAFGYVTEGIEVVDAVCESAEPTDGNGTIEAAAQPIINSIIIEEV